VGIVIGSLRCGKVVQTVGHIRAFLALGAIASTAPLLYLLVVDSIAWVVARALTGFSFAGLFIVVESWLKRRGDGGNRRQITASVALKRLVGFSAQNRFYRANRDLARIFKTEFILQYLSEPEQRRRIRRGLPKVEQLHALARDVFYGRRGRINAREL
jgi:hypothetical protein